MRNLASFSTSLNFEAPAFENAARLDISTLKQTRNLVVDRPMSSPRLVKFGPRIPENRPEKVLHP